MKKISATVSVALSLLFLSNAVQADEDVTKNPDYQELGCYEVPVGKMVCERYIDCRYSVLSESTVCVLLTDCEPEGGYRDVCSPTYYKKHKAEYQKKLERIKRDLENNVRLSQQAEAHLSARPEVYKQVARAQAQSVSK